MFRLMIVTLVLWVLTLVVMTSHAATDDPTRPPTFSTSRASSAPAKPRWVLSSTLVSRQRRSAIINNRVVVPGDMVSGARVEEISPMKVVLDRNGRQIVLVLLQKNIKQPTKLAESKEGQ